MDGIACTNALTTTFMGWEGINISTLFMIEIFTILLFELIYNENSLVTFFTNINF